MIGDKDDPCVVIYTVRTQIVKPFGKLQVSRHVYVIVTSLVYRRHVHCYVIYCVAFVHVDVIGCVVDLGCRNIIRLLQITRIMCSDIVHGQIVIIVAVVDNSNVRKISQNRICIEKIHVVSVALGNAFKFLDECKRR